MMKAIIKLDNLSMVIENKTPNERPVISGSLWEVIKNIPFESWFYSAHHWPSHKYPEIDLALSLANLPVFDVIFEKPIDFYESDGDNIA